jgi:hypothetical protein
MSSLLRCLEGPLALDGKCVKGDGLEYWVYATIDVNRDFIYSMKVYPSKDMPVTELFIGDVSNYCCTQVNVCR